MVPVTGQQAVGQGGLAVVDVGDDGEVADAALVQWFLSYKLPAMGYESQPGVSKQDM